MKSIKTFLILVICSGLYLGLSIAISNIIFQKNASGYKSEELVGQLITKKEYFHFRPSYINYDGLSSGCSNNGYFSKELTEQILRNYKSLITENRTIKPDLNILSESASGLDPHISYNGAICQTERIVNTGKINKNELMKFIDKQSYKRILGLFGEKIINVNKLNMELKNYYASKT